MFKYAFRKGDGDYIHLQGPAPQQLEHDGAGHIVASLAGAIGPCAFSSLAATRDWLATDMALRFMRAYRKARAGVIAAPAAEVAKAEAPFFPDVDPGVLTNTIATYQTLGNWTPQCGNHAPGLGSDAGHFPARRPDQTAAPLRGRDRRAVGDSVGRHWVSVRRFAAIR